MGSNILVCNIGLNKFMHAASTILYSIYYHRQHWYMGNTQLFLVPISTGRSVIKKKKLHGLSPRANYIYRATAACRAS
jgi:hypothetical protein